MRPGQCGRVIGLVLCVALVGCSDTLGSALGDRVEAGDAPTPTIVALPPRMTATTTTTSTTTRPDPSTAANAPNVGPAAPATSQPREPLTPETSAPLLPPTSVGTVPGRSAATNPATTAAPARPLEVNLSENPFRCDGQRRAFGTVSNAAAGEQVAFVARGIGELSTGTANELGQVTIHWRCDASDAGAWWLVTATGLASGRSASFEFKGSAAAVATTTPAAPPITAAGVLTASLSESPFRCNGELRVFGTISGAAPGETVSLSEVSVGALVSGVADPNGRFPIKWRCTAANAGATWTITGRGTTSGRSVQFSFRGV